MHQLYAGIPLSHGEKHHRECGDFQEGLEGQFALECHGGHVSILQGREFPSGCYRRPCDLTRPEISVAPVCASGSFWDGFACVGCTEDCSTAQTTEGVQQCSGCRILIQNIRIFIFEIAKG